MLALTATEGNYTFVYAGILLALLSLMIALTQRSILPGIAAVVLVVFGAAIGAIKMLPVAEFIALYPRAAGLACRDATLSMIPTFLFSRNQDLYREIPNTGLFACYGAYVSPAFALLAVFGLLTGRLKTLPWLVAAIVLLLLARGSSGPYSAFALLQRLPLCGNISFPTRFMYPFVFAVGAIAAFGADFVCRNAGRWGPHAVGALFVIGLVDAWFVGPPNLRYLFHSPTPNQLYHYAQFRQFWSDDTQKMTEYNMANLGAINCYGTASIPPRVVGYNQADYSGEYYLVGPGQATQVEWTPNQLTYHVSATAPTELVVELFSGMARRTRSWRPRFARRIIGSPSTCRQPGHCAEIPAQAFRRSRDCYPARSYRHNHSLEEGLVDWHVESAERGLATFASVSATTTTWHHRSLAARAAVAGWHGTQCSR